jgi:23S rRNA (uracil1939-C5)-methyltransferase
VLRIKTEKLIFGGQGLGRTDDGRIVFVWNALPGEEVEAEILKKNKNFFEAVATKIITPSPERVAPLESHWLSSSPWQILDFAAENQWKKKYCRRDL